MWNKKVFNFGKVQANKKLHAEFLYDGEIDIVDIKPSCGCTDAKWSQKNKRLSVNFTPAPVGKHLLDKNIDNYYSRKQITITTKDGKEDLLFLDATVFNKLPENGTI